MGDRLGGGRVGSLDIARFLAAMAVVAYHCSGKLNHEIWGGALQVGYHGVDFFFVLSGFVIASAHLHDLGRPARLSNYALKRVLRIYPPYWIALAIAIACLTLDPWPQALTAQNIVTNVFLIPKSTVDYPYVVTGWTLSYEMLFYLFFGLLIAMPRSLAFVALVLWPLCIVVFGYELRTEPFPLSFFLNRISLSFFFGILAFSTSVFLGRVSGIICFAAGLCLLVVDVSTQVGGPVRWVLPAHLPFSLSSALCIAGLAGMERAWGSIRSTTTDFLGNMTYGTYLVHLTALNAFFAYGLGTSSLGLRPKFWITVLASFVAGVLFYICLERPLSRWLGRRVRLPQQRRGDLGATPVPHQSAIPQADPLGQDYASGRRW